MIISPPTHVASHVLDAIMEQYGYEYVVIACSRCRRGAVRQRNIAHSAWNVPSLLTVAAQR